MEVNIEENWDDENVIHQSWEEWESNRYISILFEEREDDVHLPSSLNVTPSPDDYRDYQCFVGCGCDQIPREDKHIISRSHFHCYDELGNLYWSNLKGDPLLDVSDLQNEGRSLTGLIKEVNVDLGKAYEIRSHSIYYKEYEQVGSIVNGIQFSLQFLSLIKTRDYFRQVLSKCELKTYHGNEYLRLREVLAKNLGIPPKISRLVLPSLREPRHFENRSTGVNWEDRYARPDSLRFGIKEYQIATALPSKFLFIGIIISKEDLWALLQYLILERWVPAQGIATVLLSRVDWFTRDGRRYLESRQNWEDYLHRRRVIKEYYNILFPNAQ